MKIEARKLGAAVVLVALAAGSWWLTQLTSEPEPEWDGKLRHDPDLIVEGMESVVMTAAGEPQYEMRAERLVHYGDDGSTEIERPYFVEHSPGRAATHARARRGFVPQGTPYIRLTGDVHVAQGRDPKNAGGDLRTQELIFKLDRSR
jgi:lipopolysaccharide export system protein LptC